ncbi:facilitated trehalose transporter Tret1-2 homolog [Stomoxys calcitrans]|uniref:Major facilitator superfamily (MFS) profile domain-containing protein n=1 Tax=Stomoxys calcitrans TaxID=35570 RepID=A0A1I8P6Z2_STOCA|nr:facilitated trehalose transporter Tret1-2 homolog [Stomoxys calcitrans]XP_059221131.1 facilitated trehalose transporter Tret1-2 homolog [Stomoxys calcitrans]XP_059221132.1 facilitated trehalose transporter Tret1-2 homolog [Stomoxys calcitrans]XP_059221133.1 facilitated trehalose transporter Tret1-2 homolog [Stomoxys calcitrans]XP_059221134.1 facilitated trehalose transporter Tret1-2 homolog [Stomoxys calcitrans]
MAKFKFSLNFLGNRAGSVLNSQFRHQVLATLTVCILTFSHGVGLGWLSPTLSKLQSDSSPLDFPVSVDDASWIGSLLGLGSLLGNIVIGFLQNIIGRKACIYILALPHIILWVLIYCAHNVDLLMIGRFLGGFTGGGCYVVFPLFISEIADASIRGTLSTMLMLSVNFGVLLGFIVSTHVAYHIIPFCIVTLPIAYLLLALIFPETPQHLLRKKQYISAEESFKFYRNCDADNKQKCNEDFDNLKSLIDNRNEGGSVSYKDFVTTDALKCFATSAVLLFVNQFSGIFAFVNYMTNIFENSGSSIDPNTCTIIMGVLQIAGTYAATLFVDIFGRKILMLWSTGGMAVGLGAFGAYTFYAQTIDLSKYSFVPLLLMAFVVFVGNMGLIALTLVLLVEIFPVKIRPICASASMAILSFLVFAMLKLFPLLMHTFGISITMWFCAVVCGSSYLYLLIFLKETKGKSMDSD